ncbi:hypothetical protein [Desulfosporosinus sp. SB140]|uniref:hypothetical protein n=1 Tax=Desulfosporosinus paludis TaxID=3115649 RepID=UPI0038903445
MEVNEPIDDQIAQYAGELYQLEDRPNAIVEVKVSGDDGETWVRREIDLGGDIDTSGLKEGEIFQVNGEKYKVIPGDFGLIIEPLNKSGKIISKRK